MAHNLLEGCSAHFSPFVSFLAMVAMTCLRARRDVLMYLPSAERSLSDVAFSEPARSMRLCMRRRKIRVRQTSLVGGRTRRLLTRVLVLVALAFFLALPIGVRPVIASIIPSAPRSLLSMTSRKIECDREDRSFQSVWAVRRLASPRVRISRTMAGFRTTSTWTGWRVMSLPDEPRTSTLVVEGSSRSSVVARIC